MGQEGAYARNTDPLTSHIAADMVDVPKLEAAVYQGIDSTGRTGANWYELETITHIDKASISPRFAPLRSKHLICPLTDENGNVVTRCGKSNRKQIVWVTTRNSRQ